MGFPSGSDGKESACNAGDLSSIPGFDSWVGKNLWRRKWQPTPVLLPGKSHGQRTLVGYSLWGGKESDMTERLHFINEEVNKVKEESEKVGLKLNIQKTKIMASSPITSWQINGKIVETVETSLSSFTLFTSSLLCWLHN